MKRRLGIAALAAVLLAGGLLWGLEARRESVLTVGVYAGSYWQTPNGDCYQILDDAIALFQERRPGVRVEYVSGIPTDDYSEWLAGRILKGTEPDLCFILPEDFNLLASSGALAELDGFMASDAEFDALPAKPGDLGTNIVIGPENVNEALKDSSVIMASYDLGDGMKGLIGVVGPTRMDYAKISARLAYVAQGLSQILQKLFQSRLFPDAPTVITGDMNAEPDSPEMSALRTAPYQNVTAGTDVTYHGYGCGDPPCAIDYILTRGFDCERVEKWTDCRDGVYLSDHYPVCAHIHPVKL